MEHLLQDFKTADRMLDKLNFRKSYFLFLLAFAFQANASVTCEEALSGKEEPAAVVVDTEVAAKKLRKPPKPSDAFVFFENTPGTVLQIFSGTREPRWEDYNWLLQLKAATENSKKLLPQESKAIREKLAQKYQTFLSQDPNTQYEFVDKAYRFFEFLDQISLKPGFKAFKTEYLKHAPTDAELIEQGKKTVEANVKRLREKYALSGFKNTTELVEALEKVGETGKQALELADTKSIVTIRRPESARFWVPITGFQNQRVTGSSKGSFDTPKRERVESTLTYQDLADYQKYSVRYKPNYGEARTELDSATPTFQSNASHYGPDRWVIKKEVIEARATFTPTDSFVQPMATNKEQTQWNQLFIPWGHREFLAAYLIESLKNGIYTPGGTIPELGREYFWAGYYFEVQVWGPVTLKDVEAFAFEQTPPSPEFLKVLREHGIKVWDLRSGVGKLYEEPTP